MRTSTPNRIALASSLVAGVLLLLLLTATNFFFYQGWIRSAMRETVNDRKSNTVERRGPLFEQQVKRLSAEEFATALPEGTFKSGLQHLGDGFWVYGTVRGSQITLSNVTGPMQRQRSLAIISAAAFLMSIALIYWIMRIVVTRALGDLIGLSQAVRAIEADRMELDFILDDLPVDDPVRVVSDALHATLARIDQHVQTTKEFVAHASHELRTPLMILRSGLEKGQQQSMSSEMITSQITTLDQIDQLLTGLLSIASLQRQEVVTTPMMDELVETVVDLQSTYPKQPIVVRGSLPDAIIALSGSRRSIVRNLIENACRHSALGSEITVSCTEHSLGVANPGLIDQESLLHIWTPFWSEQGGDGHGLGLAVVKAFVEANGWTIEVSSHDKETCFTLTFA